jgi:hypothetical protein
MRVFFIMFPIDELIDDPKSKYLGIRFFDDWIIG